MLQQKVEFDASGPPSPKCLWERVVWDHVQALANSEALVEPLERAIAVLKRCQGKILICGNGGSAAHAQHLAAELVGRFQLDRDPIAAMALTTDSSILTAISNDFGYQDVFSRQVEALAQPSDVLVAFSTSGRSASVYMACQKASQMGCQVIAVTGLHGMYDCRPDVELRVHSTNTARIQEIHTLLIHAICEGIEA